MVRSAAALSHNVHPCLGQQLASQPRASFHRHSSKKLPPVSARRRWPRGPASAQMPGRPLGVHKPFAAMLCALSLVVRTSGARPGPSDHCSTVADIVRGVQQECGGSPVADLLTSVGLLNTAEFNDGHPVPSLEGLLKAHGFSTGLDLQLLDMFGSEATELMEQLRTGGISIGDRSKVRLLLGDHGHSRAVDDRFTSATPAAHGCSRTSAPNNGKQTTGDLLTSPVASLLGPPLSTGSASTTAQPRRMLQEDQAEQDSGELSMETIAIACSVLIGFAGYVLQVRDLYGCERKQ